MATDITNAAPRHRAMAEAIAMVALCVVTVVSLVIPPLAGVLAVAGGTASAVLLHRQHRSVFAITLAVFATVLIASIVMDITLFATGTQLGTPGPAAPQ